jgi:hypothetical protein
VARSRGLHHRAAGSKTGTAKPSRKRDSFEPDKFAAAGRIWRATIPIAGTPGAAYLSARGIDLGAVPDAGGLRFHPHCPWGATVAPCIVARFSDALTGELLGIRRRRIDTHDKPMSLGPTGGGVIRLSPDEDVSTGLCIGEGVETVLAAMSRVSHRGTLLRPAWATGSAGMLRDFPVLSGIGGLTILVDNDHSQAGQTAARACAERWATAPTAPCEVTLLMPRDLGADFNDLIPGLAP